MKVFFIKFQHAIPFILMGFFFIIYTFFLVISPNDELWNFQNVYKIYNGFQLYSDANVIITPIFYFFTLGFFQFFGASILSFRCFNVFIFLTYFIVLYYIFKTLKLQKHMIIFALSIIFLHISPIILGSANYNALTIVFALLGILTYLRLFNKNYFHYLQGILIFLVFFSKQNMGIYYACSIVVFEWIYKENWSYFICNQLKKFFTFCICLFFFLGAFYVEGNLFDFINYTFGGLFNFGSSNIKFSADIYTVGLTFIILIFYFYIITNKKLNIPLENKKILNLLGCIAFGTTFSVFPIVNTAHFSYVIVFYFLILFYFLNFTILEDTLFSQKWISIIYVISSAIILCICISFWFIGLFQETKPVLIEDTSSPFYKTYMNVENYKKMNTMTDYIKQKNKNGKEVIIIASDSCLTMVPLKQNHKAFDLVFNGNLGYDGENKLIAEIKNSKNTEFLIYTNEEDCFWQESKKIRNFIMENLDKTGEILNYSIYELPSN